MREVAEVAGELPGSGGNSGKSREFPEALGKSDSLHAKIASKVAHRFWLSVTYSPRLLHKIRGLDVFLACPPLVYRHYCPTWGTISAMMPAAKVSQVCLLLGITVPTEAVKKHINVKGRPEYSQFRTPPSRSLCGMLFLEIKEKGSPHRELGLCWGPFILYVGISLCFFFRRSLN